MVADAFANSERLDAATRMVGPWWARSGLCNDFEKDGGLEGPPSLFDFNSS